MTRPRVSLMNRQPQFVSALCSPRALFKHRARRADQVTTHHGVGIHHQHRIRPRFQRRRNAMAQCCSLAQKFRIVQFQDLRPGVGGRPGCPIRAVVSHDKDRRPLVRHLQRENRARNHRFLIVCRNQHCQTDGPPHNRKRPPRPEEIASNTQRQVEKQRRDKQRHRHCQNRNEFPLH